jgi:hypothetical protein
MHTSAKYLLTSFLLCSICLSAFSTRGPVHDGELRAGGVTGLRVGDDVALASGWVLWNLHSLRDGRPTVLLRFGLVA